MDFNPDDLRSMMDYVETESTTNTDEVLLKFVENSLFLESQSHHWHLQCKNYAKHIEFDELYKNLPEFVDTFIEGMMNSRGPIFSTSSSYVFQPLQSAVTVLQDYKLQCTAVHGILESEDEFGSVNSLEDIISFIDSILYKLKTLQ